MLHCSPPLILVTFHLLSAEFEVSFYFQIAALDLGSSPPNRVPNKGAPSKYDDSGLVGSSLDFNGIWVYMLLVIKRNA